MYKKTWDLATYKRKYTSTNLLSIRGSSAARHNKTDSLGCGASIIEIKDLVFHMKECHDWRIYLTLITTT